ncbi:MAG: 16S rRNA (cytidine(1402)-2'-O)-methyltransferase [bacterium]
MTPGQLYIIGTPIGNLEDLSYRAHRLLTEVDFIICEDTRVTKKLLERYHINKPLVSYHQHSKLARVDSIIARLKEGASAALVSDAGTPGISDPGNQVVAQAVGNSLTVVPIPGPSALTSLLSVAGMPTDRFIFLGFLPHKKGREKIFNQISQSEELTGFFESPHRIIKTLGQLIKCCPNSQLVLGRELTKKFEQIVRGTPEAVLAELTKSPETLKGEFVVLIKK